MSEMNNEIIGQNDYEIEAVSFEDNENEEYDFAEKVRANHILRADLSSYTNGLQAESMVSSLVSGYYVIPMFQRKYVWKKKQVANLALSLIKDVPIPPIYLYVNEKKKHVILDGQQRATSLFLYFCDLWYVGSQVHPRLDFKRIYDINQRLRDREKELLELDGNKEITAKDKVSKRKELNNFVKDLSNELKELGLVRSKFCVKDGENDHDISFASFSEEEREFLLRKRIEITVVECRGNDATKVYAEMFKLLNSGGKLLSSQEIRNGVYWELKLYDKLFEVNQNKSWRKIYGKESSFSKDLEILLKILALNYFTRLSGDIISIEYNGAFNWSNIMDDYSVLSSNWSDDFVDGQIKLLTDYLDNIKNIDNKKCNKAVFEAVFVAYTKLKNSGSIEYSWLCGLSNEKEFMKGEVLSNKQSVENRLNKAFYLIKN